MAFNELLNLVRGTTAITPSPEELNVLDGVTAGIATEGKAVVLDNNGAINEMIINALSIGAPGSEVEISATGDEINAVADKSANGAVRKFKSEALTIVDDTNQHDFTNLVFAAGTIITGVWLNVTTEETTGTTKSVSIGLSGGTPGMFLAGAAVAAPGVVKGTLTSGTVTLGVAMTADIDGSGTLVPEPYVCPAETTLTYTLNSDDFKELEATCIVEYIEFA
jgi:hypothetical protein